MDSFIGRFRAPAAGAVDAVGEGVAGDSWAPHLAGIFESATNFVTNGMAALRELRANGNGAPPAAAPQQNGAANVPGNKPAASASAN